VKRNIDQAKAIIAETEQILAPVALRPLALHPDPWAACPAPDVPGPTRYSLTPSQLGVLPAPEPGPLPLVA